MKANLSGENLEGADLGSVNLEGADLHNAYLGDAKLEMANLHDANLKGADFRSANLKDVALNDDEKVRLGMFLNEKMIGYKITAEGNIIELEIPEGAIVFSINKNKCRTNKAIVKKCKGIQHSTYKHCFEYKEGDIIEVKDFDLRYNVECDAGIHFFRTRKEAKNY